MERFPFRQVAGVEVNTAPVTEIPAENTAKVEPFLEEVSEATMPILDTATQNRFTYLNSEIGTYCKETWAKFITGDLPFDQWGSYCEQLDKLGYPEFEAMIKNAYGM